MFSKFIPYNISGQVPTEKWDKLTKYPVSSVSGKNNIVHNVKRRLRGC